MIDDLFEGIEEELDSAYAEEHANRPNCRDPITVEHIGHDIEHFSDEQIAPYVRQEMLNLLGSGKYDVKYQKRLGKRIKGSAAIVHFYDHVFADDSLHLLYYSAQFLGSVLRWEIQAVFHLPEMYPYNWEE